MNKLSDKWSFWSHSPFETDWSINSYKLIHNFNTLEDCIKLIENINREIYEKYMIFLMKNDIKPIWEDKNNKNGGCFSYKILTDKIYEFSKKNLYLIIGNTINSNDEIIKNINGISISPKKYFCIFKIWIRDIDIINKHYNINIQNEVEYNDIFNLSYENNENNENNEKQILKTIYRQNNSLY
tara:strand:+ start:1083 stop:1631 length:549 start_codon:yes stop_codon:yes gene_type:complete